MANFMSNLKPPMSRQSEYFRFRAKQKLPVLSWSKSSLDKSYDEAKDYVSSMGDPVEGYIFPFSSLVHPLTFSPSLSWQVLAP